ncbi:hypothetical protein LCGC14_3053070, partial [marine sediment metagenome]
MHYERGNEVLEKKKREPEFEISVSKSSTQKVWDK